MTERLNDQNKPEHYKGSPMMAITGYRKFMRVYLPTEDVSRILKLGMMKASPFNIIFEKDIPPDTQIEFSDLWAKYETVGNFPLN